MKVVEIGQAFGMEHLRFADRTPPKPGPRQVLLRMKAASLNYRDLLTVRGHYNPKQPLPLIPCSDGVGVVEERGAQVSGLENGDRVCPIFAQKWLAGRPDPALRQSTLGGPLDGTLSEYLAVEEEGVVKAPAHLTDEQAACLPCAAVTAWNALAVQGNLKAGEVALVQGSGGVSIFALQFARMMGARVIATSSSDEKLARMMDLGAWHGINYRTTPNWGRRVRELTGAAGVDYVVEVGGSGTLPQSMEAIRVGGQISVIGVLSGVSSELSILPVLMQNIRLQGIFVGSREMFEEMNRAIEANQLQPVVDRVFPFGESIEAFRWMEQARHFGKICIRISD